MGSGCSLGFRFTKNPAQKHKGQQFDNQSQNPEKDKNGHYNESQKSNHHTHLTNPVSTENYGANEEFIQQVHEFEKTNQIGRYFLESELNRVNNAKAIQKWDKFLSDGYKKYIKMKKTNQYRHIFTRQNESFIFKNKELYLTVNYHDGKEKELSQFIEKGLIPQCDRWSAWKAKLNVQKYFVKGLYEGLLRKQSLYVKDIKRDIGRGLNHPFFKQEDQMPSPFKSEPQQQQDDEELSNKKQYIFTQKDAYNTKQSIKDYNAAFQNSPSISKKNFDQISQHQLDQLNQQNHAKKSVTQQKNCYVNQNQEFDEDRMSGQFSLKDKRASPSSNQMNQKRREQFGQINLDKEDDNNNINNNKNNNYNHTDEVNERFQTQISHSKNPYNNTHRKLISNQQKKNNLFEFDQYQNQYKCIGQESLSKVLRAISNYFPNIGYTQGMNIVVGFLLLINGGNEEEAFWMFVALARSENFLFMGLYEKDLPIMNLMAFVLDDKLRSLQPRLHHQILNELEVNYQEWFTWWSLSIFLEKFPLYACLRFWDFIISQGSLFSIVQIIIALLKQFEQQIIGSDDRGLFQELLDSFMKGSVTDQIVESVLINAKKIQINKPYISQICFQYLNSTFCISKVTQKQNIFTDYLTQLNKSSSVQIQAQAILNREIDKRVCLEITHPLSDDGNKIGITETNELKNYENNLNSKPEDQNSELSERQVVQQPQIDYMSSDIDYNNRRIKNSPNRSVKLQNKLPPIKQKKKDVQLILPDDSNEPAKNKLLTIKNSINKSKNGEQSKNLFQINQEAEEKQKSNLPLIHLQSIQSNEIFSQPQRYSITNQQQQQLNNNKNASLKTAKSVIHKRRSSFQDVHVMSLDQIDQEQNKEQQVNLNTKENLIKFQNQIQQSAELTPHSKYFFNSPNKNSFPKRPISSLQSTQKKFNSSHNLYQNQQDKSKENDKELQNTYKEEENLESVILKNPKEIGSPYLAQSKVQSQQVLDKEKEMLKSTSQAGSSTKQKVQSNLGSIIQGSTNEKPKTKLPSIYLQQDKLSQLFNQNEIEKNEYGINVNQQHEESNSQTQSHEVDIDDDFNIENNVPQKKSLSHQTTNSIPNSSHKINKYHNAQLDSIENKMQNPSNNKNSFHSSRPSSHYSSKYEHEKRLQKQQAFNMIHQSQQQNPSNFSTPSVKQRQLPSISFQKATLNLNPNEEGNQLYNSSQSNGSINQPPVLQTRDKNKFKKFRPFSNTIRQPNETNQKQDTNYGIEEQQQQKILSKKSSTIKSPSKKLQTSENKLERNQLNQFQHESQQNLEVDKENLRDNNDQLKTYQSQRLSLNVNKSQNNEQANDQSVNDNVEQLKEHENNEQKDDQIFVNYVSKPPSYQIEQMQQNDIQASTHLKQKQDDQNEIEESQQNKQKNHNKCNEQSLENAEDMEEEEKVNKEEYKQNKDQEQISKQEEEEDHLSKEGYQATNKEYLVAEDQINSERFQIQSLKIDLGEQDVNKNDTESENKDSKVDLNDNASKQKIQNINYDVTRNNNNNNNQQLLHRDSLNSQIKKEEIAFNNQNDMSVYMNEFQQHNYSGFSINVTQGGAHNFQNSAHNSNIQQNQAKEFSVNQIPSPNNSRINDDNRSQISEYGFQNQQTSEQQQKSSFTNLPDQMNNEITFSADENKQRELKEKYDKALKQSTLEHLRDSDINQISSDDKFSNKQNDNQEKSDSIRNFQMQPIIYPQTQNNSNKQQLKSSDSPQNNQQPRPQFTPKSDRYENTYNVIPTQSPFNSQINLNQQNFQKNYQKSNSLNQLGSGSSSNVLQSISQISQNSISSQNSKFKNMANSQGYASSGVYDKINNFIPNHLPYSSSNYHLQEIKEENYGERNKKQRFKKDQPHSQQQISQEEENQTYEQSRLNNSNLSHKTQLSHRERANTQNFAENQHDILDDLSSSQFNSNASAASKPPQHTQRKPSITTQSQFLQQQQRQQQNIQLQLQQQQEFTPQRIISSAAQKNIILNQQTNATENISFTQNNIAQNKTLNNVPIPQNNEQTSHHIKRPSLKINKDYQTPKVQRQNDQNKSLTNLTSFGKNSFTPQTDKEEPVIEKQNSKKLNPLTQSIDSKQEQLKSIHSNTDFYQNYSAQKEFFQNSSAQKNSNRQLQDESSNLSSSMVSFPIPKHLITISPSTTQLQQTDQQQENVQDKESNTNITPQKNERKVNSKNSFVIENEQQQNVQSSNANNSFDNQKEIEKNEQNQNNVKTEQFSENQPNTTYSYNNIQDNKEKALNQNSRKQSYHKNLDNTKIDFCNYNFSGSINNLNDQI